jgi:hypothetical protein
MAQNSIREDVAYHITRNEKLTNRIKELGEDLAEARTIDFFFYVPDEQAAAHLAEDLRNLTFQGVCVSRSKDQWAVTGEYQASVSEITKPAFVKKLATLAAKYVGEFDGWGTAV